MRLPKRQQKWTAYVKEAHTVSRQWRSDSWADEEAADGVIFGDDEIQKYKDRGIDLSNPINRIFPVLNMILGSQAINRHDIMAKARTSKDSEMSQTMTESLRFVMDQNDAHWLVSQAFRDQTVPGIGNIFVGKNLDPRKETISIKYRDWKECFSDPFAGVWAESDTCRYKFWEKWVDLDALIAAYPEKKKELKDMFADMSESHDENQGWDEDEANDVENMKQIAAGVPWVDINRRRVRPVEIWYTKPTQCLFAVMADGRAHEIDTEKMEPGLQMQMVQHATELVNAIVPKMFMAVYVSTVILKDETPSDLGHDLYPFIPFVGYVDRFGFPYGVPRNIRGQNKEVSKRRAIALALMSTRRAMVEEGVVNTTKELQDLHKEINSLDGLAKVKNGSISGNRIKITENSLLAPAHVGMLQQSEKEIQEISGANGETSGYETNVTSGVALQNKEQRASVMTATLMDNLERSLKMIGERAIAGVQKSWTGPKMLRVTDRITAADRFIEINQATEQGIKNDVTQGKYDVVVAPAPKSDTVREQNMNMLIEWVSKTPAELVPQVVPILMGVAFEMADLPNKEALLEKIKPLIGGNPLEEDMDAEQRKQLLIQKLEAEKQAQAKQAQLEEESIKLELNKKRLDNAKIEAQIEEILSKAKKNEVEVQEAGVNTEIKAEQHQMEKTNKFLDATKKGLDIGEQMVNTSPQKEG